MEKGKRGVGKGRGLREGSEKERKKEGEYTV